MSYYNVDFASYWRPFEEEAIKKYFGQKSSISESEFLFWRLNTESVTEKALSDFYKFEKIYKLKNPNSKIINPMSSFLYTNNKDECFEKWKLAGVNCPEFFTFDSREDFESKKFEYPFLIRLNDGVTGEDTYLIESDEDLENNIDKLFETYRRKKRINTKLICVKFIDTKIDSGYNVSFRVAVAGNSVVSAYARLSDDWLAISSKFTSKKRQSFVEQNKKIEQLIKKKEKQIVNSVSCLGLHHQGVDMILDQEDNIYFLEVQPFYFSGDTRRTSPPFWNPYKPKELVDWLVADAATLQLEMPMYYNNWLDKKNHFDICYKNLKNVWT